MPDFFFTFGEDHTTTDGIAMKNRYVKVIAPDYSSARILFCEFFALPRMGGAGKWAFQYSEDNWNPAPFTAGEYIYLTATDEVFKYITVPHTNDFLRKCFAAYFGATVLITQNVKGKKIYDDVDGGILSEVGAGYDYKLVVTPLSKISDEDAVAVAKIYGCIPTPFGYITEHSPIEKIKQMITGNERHSYQVVDFLRPKYDCGYADIPSIIAAGIAIEPQPLADDDIDLAKA